MRLHFEKFDGRSQNYVDVFDQDSGEKVGIVRSSGNGMYSEGLRVDLFDGKYSRRLSSIKECSGFVKGVEVVLNHMLPAKQKKSKRRLMLD